VRIAITGGAGYIGSMLAGVLLANGHDVAVIDRLLFGGDAISGYLAHPRFAFHRLDVSEADLSAALSGAEVVYHLAAIVGFPACQEIGEAAAYRFNTDATRRVFEAAERSGARRFVFASTYSNYGVATDGRPVNEESPLCPQSLYARTKIAAEEFLRGQTHSPCAVVIPRFTTLFGVSPRTRFDLIVNQFVLEALTQRRLVIYQGNYTRSFVHVRDVVRALELFAEAPDEKVGGQIFNVGSVGGNHTKAEIVEMIREAIPAVEIEHRDLTFGGDMRDVAVDCQKIRDRLGFRPEWSVRDGIAEVRDAITSGLIGDPHSQRLRNHAPILQ